jgi:hypothetical protein
MKLLVGLGLAIACHSVVAQPTRVNEVALKAAMTTNLKDAESARFTEIRIKPLGNDLFMVCGQVNSKNSFGAYAGFTPFMSLAVAQPKAKSISTFVSTTLGDVAELRCAQEMP